MDKAIYKLIGLLVTFVLVVLSVGCATVTKGTSQTVTVTTDPPGARCTLTREGAILAAIQPTPGSMSIEKSGKDVSVSCELAEYKDTTGVFEAKFAGATAGNIILGGVIGAAIDASSGAMHEYEPTLTLTMIPEGFASIADRDAFFDKMKADFLMASEEAMKEIANTCDPNTCELQKKKAEKAKEARLVEIENERQFALIGDKETITKTIAVNTPSGASTTTPDPVVYLTSKEIIEVYSGGTWTGMEEGDRYWETYQPHKSIEKALAGKKAIVKGSWRDKPYSGRWWVEHNMLCVDFDGWDEDDDCWRMERVNDTQVRVYSQKNPSDISTETRTEN